MKNYIEHSIRVANLSQRLATLLKLNGVDIFSIYKSGLFHDIGKIEIEEKVLNKPGKLTDEEFAHIKEHSFYGFKMAKRFNFDKYEALNILHHHENFDGSGYPEGLKGNKIPLGARIIRICDTFDALTSDRPYKDKLSPRSAVEIMQNEEKNFDSEILDVFLKDVKGENIIDIKSFKEKE